MQMTFRATTIGVRSLVISHATLTFDCVMNDQNVRRAPSRPALSRVGLGLRRLISDQLLGRGGLIGRRYIGGTDASRERYAKWLQRWDGPDLERRVEAARSLQGGSNDLIDRGVGLAMFGASEFEHTQEVLEAARAVFRVTDPLEGRGAPNKPQLFSRLLPRTGLELDSPFLRFALQPRVLEAIAAYMGAAPILYDVDLWHSVSPNTDALTTSQLYHSDWEGLTQIRLLVYIHEVKPTDGPFVVIEAEASKRARERLGYRFFQSGVDPYGRASDDGVYAVVEEGQRHQMDGPEGSVAFVDTARCLHYGSRVDRDASRTLFACQYLAPSSFVRPLRPDLKAPYRALVTPGLSELQRLALGA